jgi:DNA-binding transcriptional LysR family regulator
MDWDKLKTFHFAAETGSLTAAAEKLGVSQSAVSRQIAALEESIGVPLFQRHARGLLLTGPGKSLVQLTREMQGAAKMAESALADARDKTMGDLVVTAPVAFGSTWLAPRIAAFSDLYPDVRLRLLLDDREYDLLKLEAECAIRLWEAKHQDLIQRRLIQVNVSLYAAASYLERRGRPQAAEDLDFHRVIAYQPSAASPMRELDWAIRAGREEAASPRIPVLEINNVYAMLQAVRAGFGIAALPDYMARDTAGLEKVLPELKGPSFDVYFIYPSDLRRSKRIAAFRQFLIDQCQGWQG